MTKCRNYGVKDVVVVVVEVVRMKENDEEKECRWKWKVLTLLMQRTITYMQNLRNCADTACVISISSYIDYGGVAHIIYIWKKNGTILRK